MKLACRQRNSPHRLIAEHDHVASGPGVGIEDCLPQAARKVSCTGDESIVEIANQESRQQTSRLECFHGKASARWTTAVGGTP